MDQAKSNFHKMIIGEQNQISPSSSSSSVSIRATNIHPRCHPIPYSDYLYTYNNTPILQFGKSQQWHWCCFIAIYMCVLPLLSGGHVRVVMVIIGGCFGRGDDASCQLFHSANMYLERTCRLLPHI